MSNSGYETSLSSEAKSGKRVYQVWYSPGKPCFFVTTFHCLLCDLATCSIFGPCFCCHSVHALQCCFALIVHTLYLFGLWLLIITNCELANVRDTCVSQVTKLHCKAHTQTCGALVYVCITSLAADRWSTGELRRVWVNICAEAVTPSHLRGSRMGRGIIDTGLCSVSSHRTPMIIDDSRLVLSSRCPRCG